MPALDVDLDQAREMFETNVFGVMSMVSAFSPLLIAAQGLIINICSTSAIAPYVFSSTYCATKGALASYSRTLRQELRPFGVRVMVVMAGTVKSTQSAKKDLPEGSLYKPVEDVFKWRQGFSQSHAKITAPQFAERLVGNCLAAEMPGWLPFLRTWVGRRDWYWDGGLAQPAWFGITFFGEWLLDEVCYRMFKMNKLQTAVEAERAEGKMAKLPMAVEVERADGKKAV
jgi:1-acylglycerone phosphate reductase